MQPRHSMAWFITQLLKKAVGGTGLSLEQLNGKVEALGRSVLRILSSCAVKPMGPNVMSRIEAELGKLK